MNHLNLDNLISFSLGNIQGYARRGGRVTGAYLQLNDNDKVIKVTRIPGDIENQPVFISLVMPLFNFNDAITFEISKLAGYSSNHVLELEIISFKSDIGIKDPFILDKDNISNNISYRIHLHNNQIKKIFIKPCISDTHAAVMVRFKIWQNLQQQEVARINDSIIIKSFKKISNTYETLPSIISQNYHEIIFPEVRYIKGNEKKLLISFGYLDIPKYKYYSLDYFYGCEFDRIILTDSENQWFLKGFIGLGNMTKDVIKNLLIIKDKMQYIEVITFGVSMGGYGALLFGLILKANRILAFNPEIQLLLPKSRSINYIKNYNYDRKYFDLSKLIKEVDFHKTNICVLYSRYDSIDYQNFNRVKELKNINALFLIDDKHLLGSFLSKYQWIWHFLETGLLDYLPPKIIKKF